MDKANELIAVIQEIMDLPQNAEAKRHFEALTNQYKYKSCDTGFGWGVGKSIQFVCKFEKGGEKTPLPAMVEGLKKIKEPLYFIYGLNPKTFHFNPAFKLDEGGFLALSFKLEK